MPREYSSRMNFVQTTTTLRIGFAATVSNATHALGSVVCARCMPGARVSQASCSRSASSFVVNIRRQCWHVLRRHGQPQRVPNIQAAAAPCGHLMASCMLTWSHVGQRQTRFGMKGCASPPRHARVLLFRACVAPARWRSNVCVSSKRFFQTHTGQRVAVRGDGVARMDACKSLDHQTHTSTHMHDAHAQSHLTPHP